MRVQIDETVNKAIKCSDTKYGFTEYVCEEYGESTKVYLPFRILFRITFIQEPRKNALMNHFRFKQIKLTVPERGFFC